MPTLTVNNWIGSLSSYLDGDINSGKTNIIVSSSYNPFAKPGNLMWGAKPVQIDPNGSVITDLIMAGKERVESGVTYVYCIGHTGRLYKIQVNNPATYNADYDNPVLIATLSVNSPTFKYGGYMEFFGATEKIYIGHDKGVTTINYDGSGEAFVGALGSWTQNVPRQIKQFVGKLYIGNGSNLAEIDSTATVTSYTKLSPGFPAGTQVRDIDVSVDGNYLQAVVSKLALADMTSVSQDTTIISNLGSYVFKWNGIDTGYTAFDTYPLTNLTSNIIYGNSQYVFGYDLRGASFWNPISRVSATGIGNAAFMQAPFPNALMTDGEAVLFATTLEYDSHVEVTGCMYGPYDWETGTGYWAPLAMLATAPETDVAIVPFFQTVSNLNIGLSSNNYPGNIFGKSKVYFSTMETSSAPTVAYRLYKWSVVPTDTDIASDYNTYRTQSQIFSKKVQIKEVRVYGEPWQANDEFTVDLIGSDGNPMAGGSKTFTAGSNLTIGDDFAWFTPQCKPTYTLALQLLNSGTHFHTINKVEIDYEIGGK